MDDPFDVLGIDPGADEETVERAYRRRAKETHPDRGGSREAFKRVRRAYDLILAGEVETETQDNSASAAGERRGPRRRPSPNSETNETSSEDGCRVEYLNFEVLEDHGWELTDEDLFAKAANADLDPDDHGRLLVEPGETLLEAAENRGFAWPYACRGGACSNCAVALLEGEMPTPAGHILTDEWLDRGVRLSCISSPVSEDAKVVYNVKHLPGLEELRLRPSRFSGVTGE
ncbi:ferredoxin Fer [Halosegnis sp.]|uniref:ferredoxin Fer n=1 Tax=Halosegnis sp. TaxID=2864959 RepID=UPI0035D49746